MRKVILAILLAGAATTPALAQEEPQDARQAAREARQENHQQARQEQHQQAREERQQTQQSDRSQRFEARQQQQQQSSSSGDSHGGWDRSRFSGGQATAAPPQPAEQQQTQTWQRHSSDGQAQTWQRRSNDGQAQTWRRRSSDGQTQTQTYTNQTNGSWARDRGSWSRNRDGDFRQRTADQQQSQTRSGTWSGRNWTQSGQRYAGNWNRDWRNDRRYDWRRYRDSHRSIFHLSVYFDPFGYNYYRPLYIGYRMQPYYYGEQYWIDPGMYNLPYPPPGTMWVRYWNDALLVDTYTGEVVDVIRGFFW